MSFTQLTVDGREVPLTAIRVHASRAWPGTWSDVLRALHARHLVRAAEIGVVVHAYRRERMNREACSISEHYGRVYPTMPRGGRFVGCCRFAGTDGWACAKRMIRAGLIVNVGRGVYQLADPPDVLPWDGVRCSIPKEVAS